MTDQPVPIGIVTISDRASRGIYEDKGGPAIIAEMNRFLSTPWRAVARVIEDEQPVIEATPTPHAKPAGIDTPLTSVVFYGRSAGDRGGPAGRADGDGDTIRTHGTNVIEAGTAAAAASTWPMVPTWF